MADKTFTPGDRVKIIDYPDAGVVGMIGTVRRNSPRDDWFIVNTDDALPQEIWEDSNDPEHYLFVYPSEMEAIK